MIPNEERIARQVLESIAQATSLFRERAVSIERLPSVKRTITALEFYKSVNGPPVLSGYLDAQLQDGTAVSWLLDVTWTDETWIMNLKLARSSGGEQEVLQELPTITVQTVPELPSKLSQAVRQLLEIRPPFL